MKFTIGEINFLITNNTAKPTSNRYLNNDLYNAHVWVHNNIIEKNHTNLTEGIIYDLIANNKI